MHEKVAIVTGSSKGIGKEIAFRLGKQGVNIVFNFARNDAKAQNTFHEYLQLGYQGLLVEADVSSAVGVEYLVSETLKKYNSIHILIPNATPDQPQHPISDY
jgi:NAD(P)-dependent dehydrogenase (short-subunit alcohol dehydrogenase family)